jgi:conjugal transfer/entry exclusion protein
MGIIVYTLSEYITSRASNKAKIEAIELLIDSMYDKMIDAIDDSGTASYTLDDGQMKISTEFRSLDQIIKGIQALETQLQMYINRYNGRITILRGRLNY